VALDVAVEETVQIFEYDQNRTSFLLAEPAQGIKGKVAYPLIVRIISHASVNLSEVGALL
jgi:hypothetical protein